MNIPEGTEREKRQAGSARRPAGQDDSDGQESSDWKGRERA